MRAQTISKITAFAVAVMLNSLVILGAGYVFSERAHACAEATRSVDAVATLPALVRA